MDNFINFIEKICFTKIQAGNNQENTNCRVLLIIYTESIHSDYCLRCHQATLSSENIALPDFGGASLSSLTAEMCISLSR